MFCSECGNEIGKDDKFCPNCGKMIEKVFSPPRSKQSFSSINTEKIQFLPIIIGILFIACFFMPWMDIGIISVSGFNCYKVASGFERFIALLAWLIPIGGFLIIYLSYKKNSDLKITSIFLLFIALFVWIGIFISMGLEIKRVLGGSFTNVFEAMGIGLYTLLAGIILLAVYLKK